MLNFDMVLKIKDKSHYFEIINVDCAYYEPYKAASWTQPAEQEELELSFSL